MLVHCLMNWKWQLHARKCSKPWPLDIDVMFICITGQQMPAKWEPVLTYVRNNTWQCRVQTHEVSCSWLATRERETPAILPQSVKQTLSVNKETYLALHSPPWFSSFTSITQHSVTYVRTYRCRETHKYLAWLFTFSRSRVSQNSRHAPQGKSCRWGWLICTFRQAASLLFSIYWTSWQNYI